MKKIPLSQGQVAVVDDRFYEPLLAMGSWSYNKTKRGGYAKYNCKGKTVQMHRTVWKLAGRRLPRRPHLLDHKDLDGLNNQLNNLRAATRSQNGHHCGPSSRNSSGFKGVYFDRRRKKWIAQITIQGVKMHQGSFDTAEDAARAYDKAAARLYWRVRLPELRKRGLIGAHRLLGRAGRAAEQSARHNHHQVRFGRVSITAQGGKMVNVVLGCLQAAVAQRR